MPPKKPSNIPATKDAVTTPQPTNGSRKRTLSVDSLQENAGKRVKKTSEVTAPAVVPNGNEDVEDEDEDDEEDYSDSEEDSVSLGGKFDLYAMELPFLNSKYAPTGKKEVNPEALYRAILTYQAKNDRTAKVTIPDDYTSPGAEGEFRATFFCDPFEDMPFDICVSDIEVCNKIAFKSEYTEPKDRWEAAGINARMEIEGGGGCGIASSSGKFALQPLWMAQDKDGKIMELFEGTFTFKVSYGSLYSRKGHGSGIPSITIPFWAVRAI